MVAQQVLRAAAGLSLAAALALATLAPSRAAAQGEGATEETVVLLDLSEGDPDARRDRRRALEAALAEVEGVAATDDRALAAAMAGERAREGEARAALAGARRAFGDLDCAAVEERGREAVLLLAPLRASGASVAEELRRAYVYRLLCADKFRDVDRAMRIASRLRALDAPEPPPGVPAAVWDAYPEIDASAGALFGELAVETEPPGAEVFVDHRPVGTSPVEIKIAQGEHLVSAAAGAKAGAAWVTLERFRAEAELTLSEEETWERIRRRVASWRSGEVEPTPKSLGALLDAAGVRFVLILTGPGEVEAWGTSSRASVATRIASGAGARDVAPRVVERARAWDRGPGIDPNVPLMREDPDERDKKDEGGAQEWWIYATVAGAVLLGAVVVGANELGSDRQRIEVTFP